MDVSMKELLEEQLMELQKKQENLKTSSQSTVYSNNENINNYIFELEPPEPINCRFCNKTLYPKGIINPFHKEKIMSWLSSDTCDCDGYKTFMEEEALRLKEAIKKEEQEIELQRQEREIEKLFEKSRLKKRFKKRSFENFITNETNQTAFNKAKRYAEKFDMLQEGEGLLFIGGYGTGKTHLACSIANYLIGTRKSVIFGNSITLLSKIKNTYSEEYHGGNELNILDLYTNVDLLIIDDLGKEKITEWVLEKIYYIVNERYENEKSLIITTNYDEKSLIDRLTVNGDDSTAKAILSRLNEMCTGIYMNDLDYRINK